jgi:cytochrome b561/polyisoprenoid-binding protein YceI
MTDTTAMPNPRYTTVAITLHWLIALAIIGMIALGWYMGDVEDRGTRFALIQLHKSIGITILLLSVSRIAWRLMNPPPAEPPMPALQAAAAKFVHVAFYVLIIVMPLTGWIMVSASATGIGTKLFTLIPWPHIPGIADLPVATKKELHEPLEFIHSKLAWVVIALLGLHVVGALKHQFMDKDGLMARMLPGLFGRTDAPAQPGRGALYAFGAAIALFAVFVGAEMINRSNTAAPAAADGEDLRSGPSAAASWAVDPAKSSIVFKSAYMGRAFEGRFKEWTATIQFDPANPEAARIHVAIPTGSTDTGEPYFNENVGEGDWFDSRKFPEATFDVNEGVLKNPDGSYDATGILTIKGETFPVRLPFTLAIDGDVATMHGEVTLQRTTLGIGRATLTAEKGDEEWVQDDVGVVIDVVATRQ